MKNPNLIALIGNAGSGKDTLAEKLALLGYTNVKFSEPVKGLAKQLLKRELDKGRDREFIIDLSWFLEGVNLESFNEKYPKIDKGIISDWLFDLYKRYVDTSKAFKSNDFWANVTMRTKRIESRVAQSEKLVFTDCRRRTEYEALNKLNATFIRVNTPKHVCEKRLLARDGVFDASIWQSSFETEMDTFKYDIVLDTVIELQPFHILGNLFKGMEVTSGPKHIL